MVLRSWRPFAAFGLWATIAVGCSSAGPRRHDDDVGRSVSQAIKSGLLHGELLQTRTLTNTSAPFGAHLTYFGGRVVSNIQVVEVIYGAGSYLPQVTSTASPSMATFYEGVLNSGYVDWLAEYDTTNQPNASTNQIIGRGSFSTQVTIIPSPQNDGPVIDDTNIQAELSAQIAAGNLPAPTHDAAGNNNTYYAIFFPHGETITLQGRPSCVAGGFCAYHGTIANAGGAGEIYYGVQPDFQPGSGCESGCGAATTAFGNYTQVASHELVETITDCEIGLATTFAPPLAWYDPNFNMEIGDLCNDQNAQVVGGDGVTYDVQTEFSNSQNDCVVSGPQVNPLIVGPSQAWCGATPGTATVTALGGPTGFPGDVTLSLTQVSPTPPPGAEITATFSPDPIPAPPAQGSTSTMTIQGTTSTPAGTYVLTVQGTSGTVTSTATTVLAFAPAPPAAPAPLSPVNGAADVALAPSFTWSPADAGSTYTLEILNGSDCTGTLARSYATSSTSFSVPATDALASFQPYSWRVTASNVCGTGSTSACFAFVTESCVGADVITNGGFESGLQGWSSDSVVPPPLISTSLPHTGTNALQLGTITTGQGEPFGDSAVSQTVTLATGISPNLVFWEWPLSFDSVTFDQQYVRVTPISPPGPMVELMREANNAETYSRREFSLAQFAGQTVKLTFGVHQDGAGDITGMVIDDVSVANAVCGPPDFSVQAAPAAGDEVCSGSTLDFTVGVTSVHGPNFTSPVQLSATNLPPGATAVFARNPIGPGETTTLTLQTVRPTVGNVYTFAVSGVAVTPPPAGPRTAQAAVLVDANIPNAPQTLAPSNGQLNVPLRPTLSWSAPFVPDALPSAKLIPAAFGASQYHLQLALDAAFSNIVVDTLSSDTTFTPESDLTAATQYFWRVAATNACGTSPWSGVASFIVGACSEGWTTLAPTPQPNGGVAQASAVGVPEVGKIYVIGGFDGFGFALNQTWAYDPATDTWTRKADVPSPGVGASFGSAALIGNTIYVFGGNNGLENTLWRYNVSTDAWSRGADLPTFNLGSAVAAIGGKAYLAYGSGFSNQTWQYDPATDSYTRKADAPPLPANSNLHGVALGGELHAFAGGFQGTSHVVYSPATDTWRTAPSIPFGVTDPAVGAIGGKAYVIGGRPVARTQIFDPVLDAWSQGAPITGAIGGFDSTSGSVLGARLHVFGGVGSNGGAVSAHWQLRSCSAGDLSSAVFLPFVVDGNGHVSGITNEQTSLLIDNAVSGTPLTTTCFLYSKSGAVLGRASFTAAPGELHTVSNVVRTIRGATAVQNLVGSLAVFGTDLFQVSASIVNNATGDSAFEDGQPISGKLGGFIPAIEAQSHTTDAVFSNVSTNSALLQLVAYPAAGGTTPAAATLTVLPPLGTVSYADVVQQLHLPRGFLGELTFSSDQPVTAVARALVPRHGFSGFEPIRTSQDAASAVYVPYVEDTTSFATTLLVNNPGGVPANVTVTLVDAEDPTGVSGGTATSRDVLVPINGATSIPDVVRWVLRDTTTAPDGKRGFLVVTTPQTVTAQAKIVDRATLDPAVAQNETSLTSAFSPLLVRVAPLPFAVTGTAATSAAASATLAATAATTGTTLSRFALSNPGSAPATVELAAVNATGGAPAAPFVVTLAPNGQLFTEDLVAATGLPPLFLGWLTIRSDQPVLIYNQRRSGDTGDVVPVHAD
jgi:N-acetylneuraminic acid mutarotase